MNYIAVDQLLFVLWMMASEVVGSGEITFKFWRFWFYLFVQANNGKEKRITAVGVHFLLLLLDFFTSVELVVSHC